MIKNMKDNENNVNLLRLRELNEFKCIFFYTTLNWNRSSPLKFKLFGAIRLRVLKL